MASNLQRAAGKIEKLFVDTKQTVFTSKDMREILSENREKWRLPQSVTLTDFLDLLTSQIGLRQIELKSETYPSTARLLWKNPSPFEVALSLKPASYLSHGTAVFLHSLSDEIPKTIYVNQEQRPKTTKGVLSQDRLDFAFSRSQRMSNAVFVFDRQRIVVLSGKNTGRLEVGSIEGPKGEILPVTKAERTLIDIIVRPAYAGGVLQVLEAYRRAKDLLSVNVLIATLKKMDFLYPYHQAIGFVMQRVGYEEHRYSPLQALGLDFDFYLTHGMKNPQYNSDWRLFFPQGM